MPLQFVAQGPVQIPTSTPTDAATLAWAAQVVTNGGPAVSATSLGYVDTLVKSIKAGTLGPNLNSALDRMWLLANFDNNNNASLTSLVNPGAAGTVNGSITKASTGWTGDGSTGYIDSGWNPFAGLQNYQVNLAHLGAYTDGIIAIDDTTRPIGASDGTNTSRIIAFRSGSNGGIGLNSGNFFTITNGYGASSQGCHIVNRSSSTAEEFYAFTSSGQSFTTGGFATVGSPVNLNFFLLAENGSGSAISFTPLKTCVIFGGGTINQSQATLLAGYIKTYLTSLGVTVPY